MPHIFIGYSVVYETYRFYDFVVAKLIIFSDVVFDEPLTLVGHIASLNFSSTTSSISAILFFEKPLIFEGCSSNSYNEFCSFFSSVPAYFDKRYPLVLQRVLRWVYQMMKDIGFVYL